MSTAVARTESALLAAVDLHQRGALREAEAAYRRVLMMEPNHPDALAMLGLIANGQGRHDEALGLIRKSLAINPTGTTYYNLGVVLESVADIPGCVAAFRQAAMMSPGDTSGWTSAIFNGDLHPYAAPSTRLSDRRAFNEQHCARLTTMAPPHGNEPDPKRRLKVGYISADFTDHSASMVFAPVLEGHNHEHVEVYCYWEKRGPADAVTERIMEYADHWRTVNELSDEALAEMIRADGIDILVDLSGYSNGHRLLALARKPAPIIMTGWGHVTGLGIDASDYILADAITTPDNMAEHHHERALRLPCILSFDPRPPYPEVAPPPCERNGYTTFGYFGRAVKTSEPVWAVWAQVLHRVPDSRLVFKGREYMDRAYRTRLLEFFASLRVSSHRFDFLPATSRQEHLAAYSQIDVALEPFPQGGGVTTLEATLMGVPSVAILGDHLNGRIAPSVLATLGRPHWVAQDADHYAHIAAVLSGTPITVDTRQSIRQLLLDSILCNPSAYAAAVERVYRTAWAEWCGQQVDARDLVGVGRD
jgi:protein O-GlcNAc transferase